MPLYARKDRYHCGDQLLLFYFLAGSKRAPEEGMLSLFVGHYDPIYSIRQGRNFPFAEIYWQFDWKLSGEIKLRDARGHYLDVEATFSGSEGVAAVLGTIIGRLDINDWYDVRSYFKRCLPPLKKQYGPLIQAKTLQNL